jgi:hypothetical protein
MTKTYFASGGLDMHKYQDIKPLYLEVVSRRLNQEEIITSLKNGEFSAKKGIIEFPSQKNPSIIMTGLIHVFAFVQFIPNISKKIIRKMSRIYKRYIG